MEDNNLEALKNWWAETIELGEIIPADRVVIGPPNPGSATPTLGLVGERLRDGSHTGMEDYPIVAIDFVAQAENLSVLERLRGLMRRYLAGWQSLTHATMAVQGVDMTISRSATSPSRLWVATGTIEFVARAQKE